MHFPLGPALLGLLATLAPSAFGAPADGTHNTYSANSTNDITPSLVASAPVDSPSNMACYAQKQGCKYNDAHADTVKKNAEVMCGQQKGLIVAPGWEGAEAWLRNEHLVSYNMKVEWKEGCSAPGDGTMNVLKPALGVSCFDLLSKVWTDCNNGGRGGKIDAGCLTYHYNIINGNKAGPGYCIQPPYDNSTMGGDVY